LTKFILNSNQLEGEIPTFLSQVDTLDLSNNDISHLNAFVCGKIAKPNIRTLDLSNNQIMGQLPDCWEHLNSLEFLDLSNNKISGEIPSMGTLGALEALVLRNNNLMGELPSTLKSCASLIIFDMSRNLLSGPIPSWIGENLLRAENLDHASKSLHWNCSCPNLLFEENSSFGSFNESLIWRNSNMSEEFYWNEGMETNSKTN